MSTTKILSILEAANIEAPKARAIAESLELALKEQEDDLTKRLMTKQDGAAVVGNGNLSDGQRRRLSPTPFHAPMPTRRTRPHYGNNISVSSNLGKWRGLSGHESGGRLKNPRGLW
jgi:hypothetical protein